MPRIWYIYLRFAWTICDTTPPSADPHQADQPVQRDGQYEGQHDEDRRHGVDGGVEVVLRVIEDPQRQEERQICRGRRELHDYDSKADRGT